MWDGHRGQVNIVKHRVELTGENTQQIHFAPCRMEPGARELEKAEIYEMLVKSVIKPAELEWSAPVVFAPKKNRSLRICVDYQRLNSITKRDFYPIRRMDECINSLGDDAVLSTLDAHSSYWEVEIEETYSDKTAFASHHGLYRFVRMSFGLKNVSGAFRRAMDVIPSPVKWQFALVYLDNNFVFSCLPRDHITHVK